MFPQGPKTKLERGVYALQITNETAPLSFFQSFDLGGAKKIDSTVHSTGLCYFSPETVSSLVNVRQSRCVASGRQVFISCCYHHYH